MTVIYRKLDCKKQGPYIITELFTNVKAQFQLVQVSKRINIRRLKLHFNELISTLIMMKGIPRWQCPSLSIPGNLGYSDILVPIQMVYP